MSEAFPGVSLIIRTKAMHERAGLLRRAIDSVLTQNGVDVTCIIIVNGIEASEPLVGSLQEDGRLVCIVEPNADKAAATLLGRKHVRTEFFAFLDDDDELLPGSLIQRASHLREHPTLACVATNGEYVKRSGIGPVFHNTQQVIGKYVRALLHGRNWLAAGGATFRTAMVGEEYFADLPPHREWTLIAFRIATRLPVEFLDISTYRIYSTLASQSKTPTYMEAGALVTQLMLEWDGRPAHVPAIHRRAIGAYRQACSYHRINGDFTRAWHFYRKAVSSPFGLSFVPYSALLAAKERRQIREIARSMRDWLLLRGRAKRPRRPSLAFFEMLILGLAILLDRGNGQQ